MEIQGNNHPIEVDRINGLKIDHEGFFEHLGID